MPVYSGYSGPIQTIGVQNAALAAGVAAEVRILGLLEVVGQEGQVALPAAMERRLLAALLVEAGTTRPVDVLKEALWGAAPPSTAAKVLQVYVSKLRRKLPAPIRIETRGSGYVLELGDAELDATLFERFVTEARVASREGNPALAVSLLRRALGLWRGQAYGDFAYEDFACNEAERLGELRLAAVEDRIDAELQLGQHGALTAELRSLANAHPLRERLQAQAMLALYRSGHQADALDVYSTVRRKLVDELGLEPGSELRELQQRILQQDPTLDASPMAEEKAAALPAPPNALLGRGRELEELRALLRRDDVRLVVLTGAGGSGKTRLALEAAREHAPNFANGACFINLAPVRDPALVVLAICSALGIHVTGDPLDALASALASRELLLLVDNAEHLRAGTPALAELVSRVRRVKILVTSRVVLHLSGEHVYPVDPLGVDPAVELFLERAQAADHRFQPSGAEATGMRRICERLDGLPLAIELAAGWIRTLAPGELLRRLDASLPLLTGGPRDLPARQQTLRATLEWSFDLLDKHEQDDLARLAVFAGGCTLEAAEAVSGTTLERLSSLVDHHLVVRHLAPGGSRYSLLETVRELALEQLDARGETDALRRRHAEQALVTAQSLGLAVDEIATGVPQRHDTALAEQDNMRSALDWALDHAPSFGLELAIALMQFWVVSPHEGMQRFDALLARAGEIPLGLRAQTLRDLGGCAELSGDIDRAADAYEQSLELYGRMGDERGILRLRHRLVNVALARGELAAARIAIEESLVRARAGGFGYEESEHLGALSHVEYREGNVARALEVQLESLTIVRELGSWTWGESIALANVAEFSLELERVRDAETYGRQALALCSEIGDRMTMAYVLAVLALAARAGGDDQRAGRLWGAIEAEETRASLGRWSTDRDEYAPRLLAGANAAFEQGREEGQQLSLDQVVAYALENDKEKR